MDEPSFRAQVQQDGYGDFAVREWEPNTVHEQHTHDYAVRLLVLQGELSVTTVAETRTCRAGDTGSLDARVPHAEKVGPEGVRFLVGRKQVATA